MKLVVMLCLVTVAAFGQTDVPFKGANGIVFVCADSTETLYLRLGRYLLSKGYAIDGDKDFLNIHTKDRGIPKTAFVFSVNCVVQANRILFTMDISGMVSGTSGTIDWEHGKMAVAKSFVRVFVEMKGDVNYAMLYRYLLVKRQNKKGTEVR